MDFMTLFCGIPFLILLTYFIMSFRNKVFSDLHPGVRFVLLLCGLVPIWGVVLVVLGFAHLMDTINHAGPNNRIFNNSRINRFLFGEDKCYK